MILESKGIENGIILDRFAGRGTQKNKFGIVTYSLPFRVLDKPENTKCFALLFEDKDAFPVTRGFSWIHWTACNITRDELLENESVNADFVQGLNSYISVQGGGLPEEFCIGYCAPSPPDCAHIYELTVFALDSLLDLKDGFGLNELFRKMDGHILASATIKGQYAP